MTSDDARRLVRDRVRKDRSTSHWKSTPAFFCYATVDGECFGMVVFQNVSGYWDVLAVTELPEFLALPKSVSLRTALVAAEAVLDGWSDGMAGEKTGPGGRGRGRVSAGKKRGRAREKRREVAS